MSPKTLPKDLHKLALATNYTITMCIIVQRHEFNDNKARIQDKRTRIWQKFISKSSSRPNHSPPAYVNDVPVPNRLRPALTRPNSFTADVKYLYTINEVN